MPIFSENINRIYLQTHYDLYSDPHHSYQTNTILTEYFDLKFNGQKNISLLSFKDSLNADVAEVNNNYFTKKSKDYVNGNTEQDIVYSLSQVKLFSSENETELNENMKNISRDLITLGYDDFESDFMPFLARMLSEHRIKYYQEGRTHTFDKDVKGIISPMDIVNAHQDLENTTKAGVCRDVSEFALRMMRESFQVYYNEAQQKNYHPDDYIFLQAWTTPLSQHVTVLMVDPENPRNGYDLDWGRVYERQNQEGLETPNNVGADIRLWKFDESKNYTIPLLLLKTDKGFMLDRNILNEEELMTFNSSFYKTFYSDARYESPVNKQIYWNVSAGKLSNNTYYALGSVMHKTKKLKIGKHINYYGKAAAQPYYYENSELQSQLIPWKMWSGSHNFSLLTRYIAKFESNALALSKNFSFQLVSHSQIYLLLHSSIFNTDEIEDYRKLHKTADGNITSTYGGKVSWSSTSRKIKWELLYQRRNFLSPKEVRLLSPNPFVLLENARLVCAANNLISTFSIKMRTTEVKLRTLYEYDILKTQLLQNEICFVFEPSSGKYSYLLNVGFNKQISGLNYYWYPQNKSWLQVGLNVTKINSQINFFLCHVKENQMQAGVSLQKFF
ncbi:MAG: hypothetical protein ACLGGV_06470 [Bacteroidia bacterium]